MTAKDIPFAGYDFFAYLSSGALVLAALDYTYGPRWILCWDHTMVLGLLALLGAYALGHVIAHLSSLILEELLVDEVLGKPHTLLVKKSKSPFRFVFPHYFKSLPPETCEQIKKRMTERGFAGEGEALLHHALGVVKGDQATASALARFLDLYGFARNLSVALLVIAAMCWFGPVDDRPWKGGRWWIAALLLGVVIVYRYLKFYREYTKEALVTYAEKTTEGS